MTILQEDIFIRRMESADLDEVLEIDRHSFSTPWSRRSFDFEIRNPLAYCWVAFEHGAGGKEKVVGTLVAWLILDEIHIGSLAVHPDFRQQGIGSRLIVNGFRALIAKGARTATLEVRASNHTAQALYHRFGFSVVGVRPSYYKDNGEDAILMRVGGMGGAYLDWLEGHTGEDWRSKRRAIEKRA